MPSCHNTGISNRPRREGRRKQNLQSIALQIAMELRRMAVIILKMNHK